MTTPYAAGRRVIAQHSKSFDLASRLLPPRVRDHAAAVYAWCRACDDALDLSPAAAHGALLTGLRRQLRSIYAGETQPDEIAAPFQTVVRERRIPIEYPAALLEGLRMDAEGQTYTGIDELLGYAFRVAGTVGLMMCHVLGVADARALAHAAHLGIAMQLTNIARDVAEDWARQRLYLPADLLGDDLFRALRERLGGELPARHAAAMAPAVAALLEIADRYYASGDRGLAFLDGRAALSVRTARLVYSAIATEIRRRHCDVLGGRAIVPGRTKVGLVVAAALQQGAMQVTRWRSRTRVCVPDARLSLREALQTATGAGIGTAP
jgi:phytoene synthase